jgi:hypothetical protein
VGSPDIDSSIHPPFSIEPLLGQVPENVVDPSVRQARDILQEDGSSGSNVANDAGDDGPEPSVVVGLLAGSSGAPWLAREARSDDIHEAAPLSASEGEQVIPDRCRIQPSVTHARCHDSGDMGFPLHVTDGAESRDGGSEAEGDPSNPGT